MSRNGIASLDAVQEKLPPVPENEMPPSPPVKPQGNKRNGAPRSRSSGSSREAVRYFVGKSGDPKPHLDQEMPSEAEAMVVAFKTDARLFVVQEFTVEQKIERGRVSLEKASAARPRVSTTNAS